MSEFLRQIPSTLKFEIAQPKVTFVSETKPSIPDAPQIETGEQLIGYIARVSNPQNQQNPDVSKLLKYCIDHGHWSIFEQASMTLAINTSRVVATQILRHIDKYYIFYYYISIYY
jgi:thymidylate synthase ThyX